MSNVRSHVRQESTILEQARQLVAQLNAPRQEGADLRVIAESLRLFAASPVWRAAPYREAASGEELLYELAPGSANGVSLYLVSDGPGVVSPPHHHGTWAVIAGIRGQELNHLYAVRSVASRIVVQASKVEVGRGQVLTLGANDVHSTEVSGTGSTFHLHLYGRPLHELPEFGSRCYTVGGP
jgi:predicted metal-dependent enzyme (double-stranded beta helix superfamily)